MRFLKRIFFKEATILKPGDTITVSSDNQTLLIHPILREQKVDVLYVVDCDKGEYGLKSGLAIIMGEANGEERIPTSGA